MTDPRDSAQRWYGIHQGQYLTRDTDAMVDACARHVMDTHAVSRRAAEVAAMQALGDSSDKAGWIDLDASHAGAVCVVDSAQQQRYAFTTAELLQLARQRAAHGGAPPAPSG